MRSRWPPVHRTHAPRELERETVTAERVQEPVHRLPLCGRVGSAQHGTFVYDGDGLGHSSIDPALPERNILLSELPQIPYRNGAGKIVTAKTPDGLTSPDRPDAVCMASAPLDASLEVSHGSTPLRDQPRIVATDCNTATG